MVNTASVASRPAARGFFGGLARVSQWALTASLSGILSELWLWRPPLSEHIDQAPAAATPTGRGNTQPLIVAGGASIDKAPRCRPRPQSRWRCRRDRNAAWRRPF